MPENTYDWFFDKGGLGRAQGAIDPAGEHFEGSASEASVVRETGQNSLDAVSGEGPVTMEFELARVAVSEIPGMETLQQHLAATVEATEGRSGHERMQLALELANSNEIDVLRISDFGTKGLTGTERQSLDHSPLSALTRGSGQSENDDRGGSFGIGSAVGPMASNLSTVLYRSLPYDKKETVFAGYSRLASHQLGDGVILNGDGFFTNVTHTADFEYQRPAPTIEPFTARSEPGTDIFILGFRSAEHDPNLERIRKAVIDNFLVAVLRKRLVVRGITSSGSWELNESSIREFARAHHDSSAFLNAYDDATPDEAVLDRIGKVSLHVYVDPTLEKKLHTVTMRRPLMRIGEFRNTSIPTKYAAILMCEDPEGNRKLRKLEPPTHTTWDPGRADYGEKVIKNLKKFVLDSLRNRIKQEVGDTVEISGLEKYLPLNDLAQEGDGEHAGRPHASPDVSETESATSKGKEDAGKVGPKGRKYSPITIPKPGIAGQNGEPATQGKDQGGDGKRKKKGGDKPGTGEDGDGTSRIAGDQVTFRSWVQKQSPTTITTVITLHSTEDISGNLKLAAVGTNDEPDERFKLKMTNVRTEKGVALTTADNEIQSLTLTKDETLKIFIDMPIRCKLGVL